MRVILDTNVLLSALIFHSATLTRTIEFASSRGNRLLLSTYVIDEAREVVSRKWPTRLPALDDLFQELDFETINTPITMDTTLFEIRDPMDYPVLYSAIIGSADIFVTGDKDFLDVHVQHIRILTPSEYVELYTSNFYET